MRNKIITSFFCLLLAAGVLAGLLTPDRYYSESEKRTLTQKNAISPSDFFGGKMGTEIEKYLADQFPLRDGWITVKTLAERLSGKTETAGVCFGKDGYQIDAFTDYDRERFSANLEALLRLSKTLEARDVPMQVMLVPTAVQILADKLPTFAPRLDQRALLEEAKARGLCNVMCLTFSQSTGTSTFTTRPITILRASARITATPRGCRRREGRRSRSPRGRAKCCATPSAARPTIR